MTNSLKLEGQSIANTQPISDSNPTSQLAIKARNIDSAAKAVTEKTLNARVDFKNPGTFTINGKDYPITQIRTRMNSTENWKTINITDLSAEELQAYAESMEGSATSAIEKGANLEKITATFTRVMNKPTWRNSRLALPFYKKFEQEPHQLQKISTTVNGVSKETPINIEDFDEDQWATLQAAVQKSDKPAYNLIMREATRAAEPKKPKPRPTANQQPTTAALDKCVVDAGSKGNRCAALSVAKRELELPNATIDTIITKHGLPPAIKTSFTSENNQEKKHSILAEALVQKAADNITNDPKFRQAGERSLDAIEAAIQALSEADRERLSKINEPQEKLKAYADLIRQPGQMLDLPFFLALDQPFMILEKKNDNYNICAMSPKLSLDHNPIIVFYDGKNHYQAVTPGKEGETAIKTIFVEYVVKQMQELDTELKKGFTLQQRNHVIPKIQHILEIAPEAKEKIIQTMKARKSSINENGLKNAATVLGFITLAEQEFS